MRILKLFDPRHSGLGLAAFLVALGALALLAFGPAASSTDAFLPHAFCYKWQPNLIRLHLVSDALIGLAYLAIPISLVYFIRKREDLPFNWMFLLFGVFIVACGATHWMEVWTLWNPDYWTSGVIKAVTAAASVPTAILLYLLVPRALAIPSTARLRSANEALEREVRERKRVEAELQESRRSLERRVDERTAALQSANDTLEAQRAALEEANRQKSHFLAVLSHEIRNPLHAVRLNAQVLRNGPSAEQGERAVAAIDRQVGRLGVLLEGLLDVARAERGISIDPRPIDVREAVRAAVETVMPFAGQQGQAIDFKSSPDPVLIRGDAGRIEQAVLNLVQNAVRFNAPRAAVEVEIVAEERFAVILVRDRGQGISPADLPRLFDLFAQGSSGRASIDEGLGIGLYVVRQIATLHGGTATVRSEGPGRGSEFEIRLPLAPGG